MPAAARIAAASCWAGAERANPWKEFSRYAAFESQWSAHPSIIVHEGLALIVKHGH